MLIEQRLGEKKWSAKVKFKIKILYAITLPLLLEISGKL